MRRLLLRSMILACVVAISPHPHAIAADDPFPSKPVTIIVPFVAGGSLDFTGRVIGDKLKDVLRQPVIIANRPGATNTVAALALAAAPPDGHTLLLTSGATWGQDRPDVLVPSFKMTIDDFVPVARVATNNSIFVVNAKVPANTLAELIKYSQTKPGAA